MSELKGKVAIVTGAAGNLGRAVCQALASQGASIALLGLHAEGLEAARPGLGESAAFAVDLTDPQAMERTVTAVRERFGGIDILANIAGGFTMGPPLHQTPDQDWDRMMDLNARTVFNACRAVIPHLLAAGGGRIVNVAARAALKGQGHMAPYCASKAVVIRLTESLAEEHRDDGINVNCVLPGTLDTPENRAAMPDADHGRWVGTDALADVILFLVSAASRAISGAAIPVYGRS
ncbi:MAG: SDR family NAD(P)-dependent oxidoreductase [Gammaproteobacteria bacterium]|nr:SDR family NAD(P)-dependent oxidoreductase [Candidatus Thioaporhodococcus sediminis]TNF54451.1 MAG: SDR family NAD(P)-dependent oxidoreductase [Gammaproteobacteria bacterium]